MTLTRVNVAHTLALAVMLWAVALPARAYMPGPGDGDQSPRMQQATSKEAASPMGGVASGDATTWQTASWTPEAADDIGPTARRYTIKPGDTLWSIAGHFGVSVEVVTLANGLDSGSLIVPGMVLTLPYSNETGTARPGTAAPIVTGRGLHFVASIEEETCWLFDGSAVERRWPCSAGRPESPSIPGNYTVQSKVVSAFSYPADGWMPYWLGIYTAADVENGIHGLPYSVETGEKFWQDQVGTPITFGCVMLEDAAAQALFEVAYVGMPVTILP